jgi:hypothetical protein
LNQKIRWATFWAIFFKTHPVTLVKTDQSTSNEIGLKAFPFLQTQKLEKVFNARTKKTKLKKIRFAESNRSVQSRVARW